MIAQTCGVVPPSWLAPPRCAVSASRISVSSTMSSETAVSSSAGSPRRVAIELAGVGDRQHEHEVDDGRGDQERDDRGEDRADVDEGRVIAVDD